MKAAEPTPKTAHAVKSWPGAFAAFQTAFEGIKKNPQPMLVFLAVYTVCAILDVMFGKGSNGTAIAFNNENNQLFTLVGYLVLLLALPTYTLAVADKKQLTVSQVFAANAGKYFSVLGATILMVLLFVVGVIPVGIPLIWFIPWFIMAVLVVVDKGVGPVDALKQSKQLAQHDKAKVWGLIGANIVIAIVPTVLLPNIPGIGLVLSSVASGFISLLFSCALAILYRWLQHHSTAQ